MSTLLRISRLFRGQHEAARALRFENLESRLPAAADFNWPEVAGLETIPAAATAWVGAPVAGATVGNSPTVLADHFFSALDACGDLLSAASGAPRSTESDSMITAAFR